MIEILGLHEPGLGPIVGHTTATSSKLWIKGHRPEPNMDPLKIVKEFLVPVHTRYLGLLSVIAVNHTPVPKPVPHVFRLRREFDTTGFFNLGDQTCLLGKISKPLLANTHYTVKMAVITIKDPQGGRRHMASVNFLGLKLPRNWLSQLKAMDPETNTAVFSTQPLEAGETLRFFLGSCRYPGLLWKNKESDRIFHAMNRHMNADADGSRNPAPPAMSLMVGDQIYADTIHRTLPLGLADTYAEFQERYNEAFSSPNMRHLLRHLPHYMILDDHEIEDNWHQDRLKKDPDKRRIFNLAVGAYKSHQWIHSPRNFKDKLYYSFESHGFPFFVMDLRTENFRNGKDMYKNHLLGLPSKSWAWPSQLDRVIYWLKAQQEKLGNRPKFLVSTLQFLPNKIETVGDDEAKAAEDSWPAFPTTRGALIDAIVKGGIQNVVFLCGDVHCHSTTQIHFDGYPGASEIKAFAVTASAFYWPFPFADGHPNSFVHDSRDRDSPDTFTSKSGITMDYQSKHFVQEDNFCDVHINKTHLVVQAIGKKGQEIVLANNTPAISELELAPW